MTQIYVVTISGRVQPEVFTSYSGIVRAHKVSRITLHRALSKADQYIGRNLCVYLCTVVKGLQAGKFSSWQPQQDHPRPPIPKPTGYVQSSAPSPKEFKANEASRSNCFTALACHPARFACAFLFLPVSFTSLPAHAHAMKDRATADDQPTAGQ